MTENTVAKVSKAPESSRIHCVPEWLSKLSSVQDEQSLDRKVKGGPWCYRHGLMGAARQAARWAGK